MPKGIIIQIPSGSNKTYFLKQLSKSDKKTWLDGEKVLKQLGIKNRLHLWYNNDEENEQVTDKIKKILYHITKKGLNVFFSGNPLKIKTDVIILTDMNDRWNYHKRQKKEGKWAPNEGLFTLEQQSYETAIHNVPIVINGDIPNIKTLKSFNYHINFNDKISSQFSTR